MVGNREVIPAWAMEQYWQTAWQRTAELTESIISESDPKLAEITGDDPLGSAKNYLTNPEPDNWHYLVSDVKTAVFEGLIKRGHISVTESNWDESSGSFKVGSTSIRQISANGLANPKLNNTEFNRRSIETMTEFFIEQAYAGGELTPDKAVVWITPYAHEMATDEAKNWGYFPEQQTYFCRWIEIDRAGRRTTKQLSLRGSDPDRISRLMTSLGVGEPAQQGLSASGVLMTPLIVNKSDFVLDVADVGRLIDNGQSFLGGEPLDYSYDELELISRQREANLELLFEDFAHHIKVLAQAEVDNSITSSEAIDFYRQSLFELINQAASRDPHMAREAIGHRSAELYALANKFEAAGDTLQAEAHRAQAMNSSEPLYVCGMSLNQQQADQLGEGLLPCVEFKLGQQVTCPSCRKKQVIKSQNLTPERLYCDNSICNLARVKRRQPKRKPTKTKWYRPAKKAAKPKKPARLFS